MTHCAFDRLQHLQLKSWIHFLWQLKLNAHVSPRCLFQEVSDSYFGKTLFSGSTYSTNWMALSADYLQSDRSFAGSWSWGRACVRPLAEDKYAAVLRRCSAGGWFPQRHLSQVMSLSLLCSLFSAGIRMRSVQTRPLLIPTPPNHCADANVICGGGVVSVAHKSQVQKLAR